MTELPVNSLNFGFQWEGLNMGRFALFIRLQGCPSSCFNCPHQTAAGSVSCEIPAEEITVDEMLKKNGQASRATYAAFAPEQLARLIWDVQPAPFDLVITGGEPAMHELLELTNILIHNDYNVILHTGGELPFEVNVGTEISVRPRTRLVLPGALHEATEVIFIIRDKSDLDWLDILLEHVDDDETSVFLQAGGRGSTQFCAKQAAERGFRLSYEPGEFAYR